MLRLYVLPFRAIWLLLMILCVAAAGISLAWNDFGVPSSRSAKNGISAAARPPLPVPEPLTIKPLAPEEAIAMNAATPLSGEPIEAAPAFALRGGAAEIFARSTAAECLTAAIYYEAGNESEQGQRAVAQVILNRSRHPAYPNSICAVVYQGSERKTGCQFTFTCDGSLSRRPATSSWARATRIAIDALDGRVEPSVGMATHYHANYVVPYWAPSLTKITSIGSHIFYRWSGYWGKRRSFTQAYGGEIVARPLEEPELVISGVGEELNVDHEITSTELGLLADTVNADLHTSIEQPAPTSVVPIEADQNRGVLRIDESAPSLGADLAPGRRLID